jgi:phosphatidate cytidylyltransferase
MLKTRIATSVISLTILGTVLFVLPAIYAQLVIALLILVGAWEWAGFLNVSAGAGRFAYVALIAAFMAAIALVVPELSGRVLQLSCIWWVIAFLWIFFFPTPIPMFVRWICGGLVLVPVFVAMLYLYSLSAEMLLFALVIVWAADVGAYFSGKLFGRVKLAPSISPGKTWEGVFGGLVMVLILAFAFAMYSDIDPAVLLPFCVAVAAVSIVGDLTVSMFKRTAGVKDSGQLFPGHGGILDRIDSVSSAAPVFALGLGWLGLLG